MEQARARFAFGSPMIVLLLVVSALGIAGPVVEAAQGQDVGGKREATVMTQNLYLGASLDPILEAQNGLELLLAVTEVWQAVQATDFPDRAEALAKEIAAAKPVLIGLQEAALWRTQSPGDFFGANTPAQTVAYDFVKILLHELANRGASYKVVVSQDNLDVELPSLLDDYMDIRLTDRDVILARDDLPLGYLQVLSTNADHFDELAKVSVGGSEVPILHGWVAADVKVRGKVFRFLNVHLEDDPFPSVQEAQAKEVLDGPAQVGIPVVCVGDFNSNAAGPGTKSYSILITGGFYDAWWKADPPGPGLTWGHDPDLRNATPHLTQRIDFVFYVGTFQVTNIFVVGDQVGDRSPSGLWPSDHAGVVATLRVPGLLTRRP